MFKLVFFIQLGLNLNTIHVCSRFQILTAIKYCVLNVLLLCSSLRTRMMWTFGCWTHCDWCRQRTWAATRPMSSRYLRNTRMLPRSWRTTPAPSRLFTLRYAMNRLHCHTQPVKLYITNTMNGFNLMCLKNLNRFKINVTVIIWFHFCSFVLGYNCYKIKWNLTKWAQNVIVSTEFCIL